MSYTNNFVADLTGGVHDFAADVFKVALYTVEQTEALAAYTATSEVSGGNYVAGGKIATVLSDVLNGRTRIIRLNPVVFVNVTLTCRSLLLYNTSKSNKALAVLTTGVASVSANDLTINMPNPMFTIGTG